MTIPLTLPALGDASSGVLRSRPHWLQPNGYVCRPRQPVAMFNINAHPLPGWTKASNERTLQVVVAPLTGGRLRHEAVAGGGLSDLWGIYPWQAGDAIGAIAPEAAAMDAPGASGDEAGVLVAMVLGGRRMGWMVDSDLVPLPGWNASARAWWGDDIRPENTLLTLGICDTTGLVRGMNADFTDIFSAVAAPMHLVHMSEHPLIYCAPVLLEQIDRTPRQIEAIARDMMSGVAAAGPAPEPADMIYAGALLNQLTFSPITTGFPCLTGAGARPPVVAGNVLLSLLSETQTLHRHKKLGYHIYMLAHDMRCAGPAIKAWLKGNFEPVHHTMDEIGGNLARLARKIRSTTGARVIVVNRNTTDNRDMIRSYAAFAKPLSRQLTSVAAREMNIRLDALAAEGLVDIIDVDAHAARLGVGRHLADGVHYSGQLEAALRADLLALLGVG